MTPLYVRRESLADVEAGRAVHASAVCVVLGRVGLSFDVLTWGGQRSLVPIDRFHKLWCRSPRRRPLAARVVRLFDRPHADLHLWPGPPRVFLPSWYSLAAARRALAVYGMRLGKILRRKRYGPPGFSYLGTTWSVRGRFREPRARAACPDFQIFPLDGLVIIVHYNLVSGRCRCGGYEHVERAYQQQADGGRQDG